MLEQLKRIIVVVGHYGSGKTNFSVNLAMAFRAQGKQVALVDLDIVNPYFRSADFADLMQENGIELVAPVYARSNLDIPALTARLDAELGTDKTLVIDVGGDDAGAAALGRYSAEIEKAGGCDMLYVVNNYRYLTRTSDEASGILEEIQRVSRLKVTGVVNNSNLSGETTPQDVIETIDFAQQTADRYGVPLLFSTVAEPIYEETKKLISGGALYPVKVYVKKPWEA